MSQPELVDAYRSGRIGRRAFVRGLVGLGMSLSVATAMADRVRAQAGTPVASPTPDDVYDPGTDVPVTTLPNTGATDSSDATGTVAKTLAVLGGGAAVVAGLLRRKTNQASETDA
jgi:hypothetical protein